MAALVNGEEPPAFLRRKPQPILDGRGYQRGVRVLNRPSEQRELLAEQPGERVIAALPASDRPPLFLQAPVELHARLVGDPVPFGMRQQDAHPGIFRADAERRPRRGRIEAQVLGNHHILAVPAGNGNHEVVFGFLGPEPEPLGLGGERFQGSTSSRLYSPRVSAT